MCVLCFSQVARGKNIANYHPAVFAMASETSQAEIGEWELSHSWETMCVCVCVCVPTRSLRLCVVQTPTLNTWPAVE